jgi:hypothetical protein
VPVIAKRDQRDDFVDELAHAVLLSPRGVRSPSASDSHRVRNPRAARRGQKRREMQGPLFQAVRGTQNLCTDTHRSPTAA